MANETTTTGATPSGNRILPKGEGARISKAFQDLIQGKGLPPFPDAACISLRDLRTYLDEAEAVILKSGGPMPVEQMGIAIVPSFREGKITFALVATRFTEIREIQKILYINNPVTGIHGIPPSGATQTLMAKSTSSSAEGDGEGEGDDPPVDDYTFDTVSTRP
jgi:hypothetical protein